MDDGRWFLLGLLAVVAVGVFTIVLPFLEWILTAMILAYVLYPLHRRFVHLYHRGPIRVRTAEQLAATSSILVGLLVVVLPSLYLLSRFIREAEAIAAGEIDLDTAAVEAALYDRTGRSFDLDPGFERFGDWLLSVLVGDLTGLVNLVLFATIGIALMVFLLFFLLVDGSRFVAWTVELSPLTDRQQHELIEQIDNTTWGAVIGHAVAAVVQAIVAGIGLYVAGVPNAIFWTLVMAILAFLPLIGVFLVWAPAAGYLLLVGDMWAGVLLAFYGLTIVSLIDMWVRPLVIDQQARLNPAVILIGVFGGIYTIGFVGLFVGPILIGVFVAILETVRAERFDRSRA